jgi:hypothetical protein
VHCRLPAAARHRRCLRMPKRARSSIRRSPSPSQLPRRWARLRMTRLMSEVNLRCRTRTMVACCYALCCMVVCGLVQVPTAASTSARDLPPNASATRPEHEPPSYAWLNTAESIAVESNQHDEASIASSLARVRSRRPALTISVAAAEPSHPGGLSDSTVAGL